MSQWIITLDKYLTSDETKQLRKEKGIELSVS